MDDERSQKVAVNLRRCMACNFCKSYQIICAIDPKMNSKLAYAFSRSSATGYIALGIPTLRN